MTTQQPISTTFPTPADLKDIQGDVVLGLRKRYEDFLFFTISDVAHFKAGLKHLIPAITTTEDIQQLDQKIKALKARHPHGTDELLKAIGINIAFTFPGLKKLGVTDSIGDDSFNAGQLAHAEVLGDQGTTDANGNFTPSWLSTFKGNIDGIVIVAGESKISVGEGLLKVKLALGNSIHEVLHVEGNVRSGSEKGHEHFGFLDGISVPGIVNLTDIHPGQQKVEPGVLLLGQPGDDNAASRPAWARNGSILVYRHLAQLVPEFSKFLHDNPLPIEGLPRDKGSELLGARLVGRWKSGAPVVLAPTSDDPALGADPERNNNFTFLEATDQSLCPFAAHVRKTNPRTDLTAIVPDPRVVEKRSIMRAGIPFGPEVTPEEAHSGKTHKDHNGEIPRGLAFVCYQSILGNGFEFLQESWADKTNFPPKQDASGQPIIAGFDPIIGQNGNNARTMAGSNPTAQLNELPLPIEFVVSRGGAYFFSPSLTALKTVLTA